MKPGSLICQVKCGKSLTYWKRLTRPDSQWPRTKASFSISRLPWQCEPIQPKALSYLHTRFKGIHQLLMLLNKHHICLRCEWYTFLRVSNRCMLGNQLRIQFSHYMVKSVQSSICHHDRTASHCYSSIPVILPGWAHPQWALLQKWCVILRKVLLEMN